MVKNRYDEAGVNVARGEEVVRFVKKQTTNHKITSQENFGRFGGWFDLDSQGFEKPVLVASTDGVGTKLLLAHQLNNYSGLGQDLVAMNVNDVICERARPLFFLDYIACQKIRMSQLKPILSGMMAALKKINCVLLGGETAEMNDLYGRGDFDLAGTCVGAVERNVLSRKLALKDGDVVVGIASSGCHANGFSLVRKICQGADFNTNIDGESTLGQLLLTPTEIYVNCVLELLQKSPVSGLAHVTGGGLPGNMVRILPPNLDCHITTTNWNSGPLFKWLQHRGKLSAEESYATFNMGIGFVICIRPTALAAVQAIITDHGYKSFRLGLITPGSGKVSFTYE